jgi:hypothetical protein
MEGGGSDDTNETLMYIGVHFIDMVEEDGQQLFHVDRNFVIIVRQT